MIAKPLPYPGIKLEKSNLTQQIYEKKWKSIFFD